MAELGSDGDGAGGVFSFCYISMDIQDVLKTETGGELIKITDLRGSKGEQGLERVSKGSCDEKNKTITSDPPPTPY